MRLWDIIIFDKSGILAIFLIIKLIIMKKTSHHIYLVTKLYALVGIIIRRKYNAMCAMSFTVYNNSKISAHTNSIYKRHRQIKNISWPWESHWELQLLLSFLKKLYLSIQVLLLQREFQSFGIIRKNRGYPKKATTIRGKFMSNCRRDFFVVHSEWFYRFKEYLQSIQLISLKVRLYMNTRVNILKVLFSPKISMVIFCGSLIFR